jgi:hypothetical protein
LLENAVKVQLFPHKWCGKIDQGGNFVDQPAAEWTNNGSFLSEKSCSFFPKVARLFGKSPASFSFLTRLVCEFGVEFGTLHVEINLFCKVCFYLFRALFLLTTVWG